MLPIASPNLNLQPGGLRPVSLAGDRPNEKVSAGAMLNDRAIRALLDGLCEKLRRGSSEQAKMTLGVLDFERLLRPTVDSTGCPRPNAFAVSLGAERVRETGSHLQLCRLALTRGDIEDARARAEEALGRWSQLRETDQEER
jgi:hypothetical protein